MEIIQVDRQVVVDVTTEILKNTHWNDDDLLEIARTAKYLSLDWYEDMELGSCGCLIGTWRKAHGLYPNPNSSWDDDETQAHIGLAFTYEMSRVLGRKNQRYEAIVLEVIDHE